MPSRAEIADALTLTKGSRVRIDETTGTLTLMPGTQIDLGAVAKGYAVEEAAKVLQKEGGFQTALINAGGNIKVLGEKPDHKPWRIGIQDPKDPERSWEPFRFLPVQPLQQAATISAITK